MAKVRVLVTVVREVEEDEVPQLLGLLGVDGAAVEHPEPAHDGVGPVPEIAWTVDLVRAYIGKLKPHARDAVAVLAQQVLRTGRSEVPFETIQQTVGLDGTTYGGAMASCGFALNRMRRDGFNLPRLFSADYDHRQYLMTKEIAGLISQAVSPTHRG